MEGKRPAGMRGGDAGGGRGAVEGHTGRPKTLLESHSCGLPASLTGGRVDRDVRLPSPSLHPPACPLT